jgi:hypothetical protein
MPTPVLIARSGVLERHYQALWQASQGSEAGLMSSALAEARAALQAHRLEIAQYHQQQDAKFAAINARLQARRAPVGR